MKQDAHVFPHQDFLKSKALRGPFQLAIYLLHAILQAAEIPRKEVPCILLSLHPKKTL